MNLKEQFMLTNLCIYAVFGDQILNMILQANYDYFGLENVFIFWWCKFYIENMGTNILKNER